MLVSAYITPHPPIIIPEIGQDNLNQVPKTIEAMEKLGDDIATLKPETVVIISPHSINLPNSFGIYNFESYQGNLAQFGAFNINLKFEKDQKLSKEIIAKSNFPLTEINSALAPELLEENNLDHGILVPLYYLSQKYNSFKLVPLTFSMLDLDKHFEFGKSLGKIIKESKEEIVFVASGDLSHRLTPEAPSGYSPKGKEFDRQLVELIKQNKPQEILKLDQNLIQEAGECGLRSIVILFGVLSNFDYELDFITYEGPFGVGYATGKFKIKNATCLPAGRKVKNN